MSSSDAQKSVVHDTTGDASGSPSAGGDRKTTRADSESRSPTAGKIDPHMPDGTTIDDSDEGGQINITSSDPDLNPPRVGKDFPDDVTVGVDDE